MPSATSRAIEPVGMTSIGALTSSPRPMTAPLPYCFSTGPMTRLTAFTLPPTLRLTGGAAAIFVLPCVSCRERAHRRPSCAVGLVAHLGQTLEPTTDIRPPPAVELGTTWCLSSVCGQPYLDSCSTISYAVSSLRKKTRYLDTPSPGRSY